ncbi:gamma-butyrobetaine hydroxylase [Grosmannia clavigera kw1407]|uniref:Gamma-butyrobetaine hydroxylase n=1 Tax=Grosmannia clavigera (strain kw1407 / UAMH 11150) TaxID=655863 RepID=F0XL10_GROCL|nr:gamma-butyrobetaine hydroxylase [Grosmannia clavigera kw1407]EFX01752.1 gamma-butyrobetaine hydroxylase [Grosmannia clavigera kw1407]
MSPSSRFSAVGHLVRGGARPGCGMATALARPTLLVATPARPTTVAGVLHPASSFQQTRPISIQRVPVRSGKVPAEPAIRSRKQTPTKGHPFNPQKSTTGRLRAAVSGEPGSPIYGKLLKAAVVGEKGDSLSLQYEGAPEAVSVSTFWLRDSCQCEHCVTLSSGQKKLRSSDLPERPAVKHTAVAEDGILSIEWAKETDAQASSESGSDTPHVSTFASDWLLYRMAGLAAPYYPAMPERRFWDRARLERELRPVAFEDWKDGNSPEFWRALLDLYQLGILIVDRVPETETAVLDVANAIGNIQHTFYGETWDVVSKPDAENVAYTNVFLCLHQDLMYMNDPPYIQLLHCLRNDCDGGESIFSDSVRAAWEMELQHPELIEPLATTTVRYHYERNGHYYFHGRTVLERKAKSGHIQDTAWSPPFQDSFSAPHLAFGEHDPSKKPDDRILQWRRAAKVFSDNVEAPQNVYEVKMKPGQCVLFNNRRVLHGRQKFNTAQGHRWLKGTYISEQAFSSKVTAMIREKKYAPALPTKLPLTALQTRESELAQVARLLKEAGPAAT